jgi:hypothetical protein
LRQRAVANREASETNQYRRHYAHASDHCVVPFDSAVKSEVPTVLDAGLPYADTAMSPSLGSAQVIEK